MVYLLSKMTILCRTSLLFLLLVYFILLTIFGLFWQVDLSNITVLENGIGHP